MASRICALGARPASRVQTLGAVVPHRKELVFASSKLTVRRVCQPTKVRPFLGHRKDLLNLAVRDTVTAGQVPQLVHVVVVDRQSCCCRSRCSTCRDQLSASESWPVPPRTAIRYRCGVQRMRGRELRVILCVRSKQPGIERRRTIEFDQIAVDPQQQLVVAVAESEVMSLCPREPKSARSAGPSPPSVLVKVARLRRRRCSSVALHRCQVDPATVLDAGLDQLQHQLL